MQFDPPIPEVVLIRPRVFGDARGYFFEILGGAQVRRRRLDAKFVQDNHSHSVRHTLRGLHYQIQQPQGKLVRVTRGAVFDVAVDIRRSSRDLRHVGRRDPARRTTITCSGSRPDLRTGTWC